MFDPNEEYMSTGQEDIIDDLLRSGRHNFYIEESKLLELEEESFESSITKDRAQEIIEYLQDNRINTDLDVECDYSIDKDNFYND